MPPDTSAEIDRPPSSTTSSPPLPTVVDVADPPDDSSSIPPERTDVLTSFPAATAIKVSSARTTRPVRVRPCTPRTPPLRMVALAIVPPASISVPPRETTTPLMVAVA